jgi:hypothetical protein
MLKRVLYNRIVNYKRQRYFRHYLRALKGKAYLKSKFRNLVWLNSGGADIFSKRDEAIKDS